MYSDEKDFHFETTKDLKKILLKTKTYFSQKSNSIKNGVYVICPGRPFLTWRINLKIKPFLQAYNHDKKIDLFELQQKLDEFINENNNLEKEIKKNKNLRIYIVQANNEILKKDNKLYSVLWLDFFKKEGNKSNWVSFSEKKGKIINAIKSKKESVRFDKGIDMNENKSSMGYDWTQPLFSKDKTILSKINTEDNIKFNQNGNNIHNIDMQEFSSTHNSPYNIIYNLKDTSKHGSSSASNFYIAKKDEFLEDFAKTINQDNISGIINIDENSSLDIAKFLSVLRGTNIIQKGVDKNSNYTGYLGDNAIKILRKYLEGKVDKYNFIYIEKLKKEGNFVFIHRISNTSSESYAINLNESFDKQDKLYYIYKIPCRDERSLDNQNNQTNTLIDRYSMVPLNDNKISSSDIDNFFGLNYYYRDNKNKERGNNL